MQSMRRRREHRLATVAPAESDVARVKLSRPCRSRQYGSFGRDATSALERQAYRVGCWVAQTRHDGLGQASQMALDRGGQGYVSGTDLGETQARLHTSSTRME